VQITNNKILFFINRSIFYLFKNKILYIFFFYFYKVSAKICKVAGFSERVIICRQPLCNSSSLLCSVDGAHSKLLQYTRLGGASQSGNQKKKDCISIILSNVNQYIALSALPVNDLRVGVPPKFIFALCSKMSSTDTEFGVTVLFRCYNYCLFIFSQYKSCFSLCQTLNLTQAHPRQSSTTVYHVTA